MVSQQVDFLKDLQSSSGGNEMVILYLGKSQGVIIKDLALEMKDFLHVQKIEVRESDFYHSGSYFKIDGMDFKIKISETDDEEFTDFEITISISGDKELMIKDQVAKFLLSIGVNVVTTASARKGAIRWQPVVGESGNISWLEL